MFLYICVRFCVIFLMIRPNFQQLRAPLYENKSASQGQLCNNSAGCGNPAIKKDKEAINSFFKNEQIYNVSKILDDLLANYDPIQRPNCLERGKPPTVVFVDIYVRSMSRITELDMEYKFECYFRQRWVDPRLSYKLGPNVLTVNIKMLERLWKPDTFFVNSYSANVSGLDPFFLAMRTPAQHRSFHLGPQSSEHQQVLQDLQGRNRSLLNAVFSDRPIKSKLVG